MMSQSKKLSIAFYWHMHQPVYQLTPDGDYLMPWVRLHAVKDYLDMALWVNKFKNLKLNFNFVPVLLDSIIEYAEHDAHTQCHEALSAYVVVHFALYVLSQFLPERAVFLREYLHPAGGEELIVE